MLERTITASVLILALLVVRKLFWNTLSRRVQYALWALVLLRLLIPWNLPAAQFSVLNAAAPVQQAVEQRLNSQEIARPDTSVSQNTQGNTVLEGTAVAPNLGAAQAGTPNAQTAPTVPPSIGAPRSPALSLPDVLFGVWIAGMAALALFFFATNLRFALKVRGCRILYRERRPGHPAVYLVPEGAVPSPCLFGGGIYVTPAVVTDPERLRMVLLHEETHARHWDPLWSLLRCLCLTVWWFNPLVWAAAVSSRTDCELACDESVLKRLGSGDSYQYGQTLLSLVHVNGARNPLCAATAMSAGAKQLKERISRIVHPRQVAAATLAVLFLAVSVCACTFTGSTAGLAVPLPGSNSAEETRTLSGPEIRWFNDVFFNGEGGINIHNQFANPINLYDRPQDINLFDLLYVHGYSQVPAAEYEAAFGEKAPAETVMYCWKITTDKINAVLQENMGLTLEETAKKGMDSFAYASDYDAYYWFPGGTNWTVLSIQYGTQTGNQVTLYHYSDYDVPGWYAVTLEGQADGSWHFLSNVACEAPAIPLDLPEGEPMATIPLGDLTPYEAPALSLTPAPEGTEYTGSGWSLALGPGGTRTDFGIYRTPDGGLYAGISQAKITKEDGPVSLFLKFDDGSASLQWFTGLAGEIQGIQATYHAPAYQGDPHIRTDYITVREDGTPVLLARTDWTGTAPFLRDVNGDGLADIAAEGAVFLAQDGALCRVDMDDLLQTALPEITYWNTGSWDPESRLYTATGADSNFVQCLRTAAIVGDNLQVWGDTRTWTDHLPEGTEAYVPEDVIAVAKDWLSNRYLRPQEDGTWLFPDGEGLKPADDWRLESFGEAKTWYAGDETFEGWCITFGAHAADPDGLFLVGDQYMEEDNWAHIGQVWLLFRLDGDTRTFLTTDRMGNDEDPGWGDFLISVSAAQKTSASITRN